MGIFGKEYINMLLSFYFLVLGIFALSHMMSPVVLKLIPSTIPIVPFHLKFTQGEGDSKESVLDYQFNTHDLVCLGLCSVVGVWYILKKHWLANDLLGMAFAVNGVELLHLNNVVTGCILLGGLFFYDIFWVFGTDVMVTVAKSFEAPIKLVFPQDLLENGPMGANNFAMLGLGDIVIPGIFIPCSSDMTTASSGIPTSISMRHLLPPLPGSSSPSSSCTCTSTPSLPCCI